MSQAAITARLGLDQSEFRSGLNAAAAASKAFAQAQAGAGGGGHGTAAANEEVWKSENAVERAAISMGDAFVSAQSGAEALAKAVEFLHKGLKLALPAAAAAALIGKLLEAGIEKIGEVKKAALAMHLELDKPLWQHLGAGPEDAIRSIDTIKEKIRGIQETLPKENARWDDLKTELENYVTMGAIYREEQKALKEKEAALDRIAEISASIARTVGDEADAREKAAGSEREVELLNNQLALEKKIREIKLSSAYADAKVGQQNLAEQEAARQNQIIEEKFAAKTREIALERNLLDIKLAGYDVDKRSADARLGSAKEERDHALTSEARAAAQVKVDAAELAVTEAVKTTAELRTQQKIEQEIAKMRAPESAKEMQRIALQREALEKQRATATKDEQAVIDGQLAKNRESWQRALAAHRDARKSSASANLEAGQGLGEAEKVRVMQLMIELQRRYVASLVASGRAEATTIAEARAQLQQMKNGLQEILEKREEGVKAATLEGRIMRAEMDGNDQLVRALQTKLKYEQLITEAKKDGNTELEKELRAQEKLAIAKQAKDLVKERKERLQLSLSELAAIGTGSTGSAARRAAREEARAKRRAAAGDIDGAKRHQDRADAIKRGISTLKESDKDLVGKFKGALDGSHVLQEIKVNTDNIGKNR